MWRLSKTLGPWISKRVRDKTVINFYAHQIAGASKPLSLVSRDPMFHEMCERGNFARRALKKLVDILKTGGADRVLPQAGPSEHNSKTATAIAPRTGTKASALGSARSPGVDDSRLSVLRNSMNEVC